MPDSIDEVKDRLRECYLGQCGIHAVGVSRAKQAIRVYVSPQTEADQSNMLEQMRESAKPFPVIVIREERPGMT